MRWRPKVSGGGNVMLGREEVKFTVRPYRPDDLSAVMSAWENASKIAHSFVPEDFLARERYNIPHVYLPNAETWVIEQGGRVIGFLSMIGNLVGGLFVEPAFHGKGAGWALMEKAQELYGSLDVDVFAANVIGRAFYERCGFRFLSTSLHEDTGLELMRLTYGGDTQDACRTAGKS